MMNNMFSGLFSHNNDDEQKILESALRKMEAHERIGRARSLRKLERFEEAIALLKETMRLNPIEPDAATALAVTYMQIRKYAEAREVLEAEVKKDYGRLQWCKIQIFANLGQIAYKYEKNIKKAIALYERTVSDDLISSSECQHPQVLIDIRKEQGMARAHLADCYFNVEDYAKARIHSEAVLRIPEMQSFDALAYAIAEGTYVSSVAMGYSGADLSFRCTGDAPLHLGAALKIARAILKRDPSNHWICAMASVINNRLSWCDTRGEVPLNEDTVFLRMLYAARSDTRAAELLDWALRAIFILHSVAYAESGEIPREDVGRFSCQATDQDVFCALFAGKILIVLGDLNGSRL